jgi:glycosyltransferase involved in cell wall biosynthesis
MDVLPLELDEDAYLVQRRRWERYRDRYRRAAAIIAISEHTAETARRRLGIDAERISVVHLGVGPEFRPPAVRPVADPPYLLLVAEYAPHKGHREAFEIISALAERGHPHRLKVAGRVAPWVEPRLMSLVSASPRPDRIDVLGFAPDLVSLYQGASAVIVTSHYEGFGLPAVEAMATATPVVAFATTATSEMVDDGGTLVPDGDVQGFVDAVDSLLVDQERWREASARALRRSAAFDWGTCVERHAEVYRSVADRNAPTGRRR